MPIYKNIGTSDIYLPDLNVNISPGVTFATYRYYNIPDLELIDNTIEIVPICIKEDIINIDTAVSYEASLDIHYDCKKIEIFDISAPVKVSANVSFIGVEHLHARTLYTGDRFVIYNRDNKIKTLYFYAVSTNVSLKVVQSMEE